MSHNEEVRQQLDEGCAKLGEAPLAEISDLLASKLDPERVRNILDTVVRAIMELQVTRLEVGDLTSKADDVIPDGAELIITALAGSAHVAGDQARTALQVTGEATGDLVTSVHGMDDGTPNGHLETALGGIGHILSSLDLFDAARLEALGALGEAASGRADTIRYVEEYKQQSL